MRNAFLRSFVVGCLFAISFFASGTTMPNRASAAHIYICTGQWECAGSSSFGCVANAGMVPICLINDQTDCFEDVPGFVCSGTDANKNPCTFMVDGCKL